MRFTHIDINFDVWYEGHQNCPKILSMNILRVFSDHHLWHQNWRQYLWTSLCQFNFFVNLLHSLGVSFFDIWHLFDNLTFFWQLDIFLIFWEQIAHGPHCPCGPYPCTPLPMYPIAYVAHIPCTPYPRVPIVHVPRTPSGAHCPYAPYPQYPIAHVTHCPCGPYPLYPIPLCPIAHRPHTPVPHCPYPLYPMCPIAHRPHGPCGQYPLCPIPPVHYCPMCPIAHHPCPPLGNGPYG